ncbi:hypothetical protein F6P96_08560 [Escherichia coli]|nr:hypothetical protein F6P96_08560 [Escherichia coli]
MRQQIIDKFNDGRHRAKETSLHFLMNYPWRLDILTDVIPARGFIFGRRVLATPFTDDCEDWNRRGRWIAEA